MGKLEIGPNVSGLSIREGFELLASGAYDDRVRRLSFAKRRRARRIKRRLRNPAAAQAFLDEVLPEIERSREMVAAYPVFASREIDPDTALGWNQDEFWRFLDDLLERLPSIIDAILSIIVLFASLLLPMALPLALLCVFTLAALQTPHASAQQRICVDGVCYTIPARSGPARSVLSKTTRPARAAIEALRTATAPAQAVDRTTRKVICVDGKCYAAPRPALPAPAQSAVAVLRESVPAPLVAGVCGCGCNLAGCKCGRVASTLDTLSNSGPVRRRITQPLRRVTGPVRAGLGRVLRVFPFLRCR